MERSQHQEGARFVSQQSCWQNSFFSSEPYTTSIARPFEQRSCGEIPSKLTSLTFLSVFDVSWNHLIGMIPGGGQFLTFPSSTFEGNSRLCGLQLQIDCNPKKSGNVVPPSDHANQSNGTNFDWIFAVAGYGLGLMVGVVIEHVLLSRNRYYLEKFMNTINVREWSVDTATAIVGSNFTNFSVFKTVEAMKSHLFPHNLCLLFTLSLLLPLILPQLISFSTASSDSSTRSPLCLYNQSSALLQFKVSFTTDVSYTLTPFSKLWSWKANTDCCTSWDGVTCDDFGFVIGLNVSDSGIVGNINSSNTLFNLYHLQNINLAFNDFNSSSIPAAFSHLQRLTHLNLSAASFSGQIPLEITHLKHLVSLDLSFLHLEVNSPNSLLELISNFSSIKELHLDSMDLTMKPAEDWFRVIGLAELHNLQVLSMSNCHLSGQMGYYLVNHSSLSHLYLSKNNITHFPQEMFHLPSLQILDLYHNVNLTGSLPEFPQPSALQQLILTLTQFSGSIPHSIGNLKSLKIFYAKNCNFSGPIPYSFSNLSRLEELVLAQNAFIGPLPSLQSPSKTFRWLDLSFNRFTGPIPSSYANNRLLRALKLSNNFLTGTVPSSLFNLPFLETILLDENQLSGEMDDDEISPISSSPLYEINLNQNRLGGPIPPSLFKFPNLQLLNLRSNSFHGVLDPHVFVSNITSIDLSNNSMLSIDPIDIAINVSQLSNFYFSKCNLSKIPEFFKYQEKLKNLDLSNNHLEGKMPEWIWNVVENLDLSRNSLVEFEDPLLDHSLSSMNTLFLSNNNFEGSIPILPSSLTYVSLANNKFSGTIPTTICNTSCDYINLSGNDLSATIPPCLVNMSSLLVLDLSKNRLQGNIPDNFGDQCGMARIFFGGNQLEGPLPRSLANCSYMEVIDLGNNQISDIFPFWLEDLEELQALMLRSNRLHGTIGHHHRLNNSSFPKLHIVDLSSNKFTGHLPMEYFRTSKVMTMDTKDNTHQVINSSFNEYYKFSLMVPNKGQELDYVVDLISILNVLDLSSNQFEGEIPELVGEFKSLAALNFSHNNLIDEIPSSLGNLKHLQSLDLSNNDLTGEIPLELASLTFLSVFNVSLNHLVGRRPSGTQFDTFSRNSFQGNLGLCGSQLQIQCNPKKGDDAPTSGKPHSSSDIDWRFALAGCGSGVIIGVVIEHFILPKNMYYLAKILAIERFINETYRQRARRRRWRN
ncbi:hypothetical protein Sjap_004175 [Stephania japonica]|uniref:Leucine-rich repeat-containing N-terminal plant-type domain-containing protein n=1 Tax=Stephania japonica TaxID=461633 RepID=A0AAP0K3Z8_9MAGN